MDISLQFVFGIKESFHVHTHAEINTHLWINQVWPCSDSPTSENLIMPYLYHMPSRPRFYLGNKDSINRKWSQHMAHIQTVTNSLKLNSLVENTRSLNFPSQNLMLHVDKFLVLTKKFNLILIFPMNSLAWSLKRIFYAKILPGKLLQSQVFVYKLAVPVV